MNRLVIFFGCLLSFAGKCAAQEYKEVNISLAEGLSQSSVYTISQDAAGFMWFGTQDGLNQYDGLRFTTYYNEPFDSNSLSSANVMSLLHDSKGRMWIGTANGGVNIFFPDKNLFVNPEIRHEKAKNPMIQVIREDKNGSIWVGTTEGLYRAEIREGQNPAISFEEVFCDTSFNRAWIITSLISDKPNSLWAGTRGGLFHLELQGKSKPKISAYRKEQGLEAVEVLSLACDTRGRVWAGTARGLSLYDAESGRFHTFSVSATGAEQEKNYIYSLCATEDGSILIGTYNGLYCIDRRSADEIPKQKPEIRRVLANSKFLEAGIISIAEDRISKGLLWIGTEAQGVVKVVPVTKKFHTNHMRDILSLAFVFSIYPDENNLLWIGTTSGLVRYDRGSGTSCIFKRGFSGKNSLWSNSINSIRKDAKGNFWIGTPSGLHRMTDPYSSTPRFEHVVLNDKVPEAPVRHLYMDKEHLYVVLPARVIQYDLSTHEFTSLLTTGDSVTNGKAGFALSSFLIDSRKNIWLTSNSGLLFYRRGEKGEYNFNKPEEFIHSVSDTNSLRCNTINDVMEDKAGRIWLATFNGLTKADIRNGKVFFTNYSTANGMKNNAVYGVLESSDGTLWMSTNGGLTRYDPSRNSFSNYDLHDGLQSNEFDAGAYYRSDNNEMFFGGVNGYTSFFPGQIEADAVTPLVHITSFELGGNEARHLPTTGEIELRHNENSFSIDFVALHYADPEKNQYAYMLEGFQKEWTKSGTSHRVNFTQLPPGKYVFKVKGSNADGLFDTAGDSLTILIRSPFWQTPWFYISIAVLVGVLFWLLHLYRLRMKDRQMKEIEQIRKETAADFHDELGHKLTTITWFGEILKKKLRPEETELRSHVERITETSGNLYHTMKDLVWAMDPGKDSLNDLYVQLKEFGESLFDQTGVEFIANDVNGELKGKSISLAQKRHVLLIFKETMHNSFKHSKGSQVFLGIQQENNHFTLRMEDNGKGFLFDWKDTGNGLKNVRKRTELIKGKIKINSGENGTLVELEVPLGEN